ncbi:MAG TPA: HdeD family acid-resistance protein [Stellaceae bacterium]|nr:HdeD family acid-resistance protein [Stellaceae bacterium]
MSSINPPGNAALAAALRKTMHEHWRLLLTEGIILVVLGAAAILVPPLAGLAVTIFLGWLFLVGGIVGLVATMSARQAPGFGWALLSAIVALVAGGVLLWNPLQGLLTLTYVLIAYFIVDGVLMIIFAIAHRRELSGRWEWLMLNGVIDLVLAAIILSGLPGSFAWALGLLVGIDLVFGGCSLIAMALAARHPTTT